MKTLKIITINLSIFIFILVFSTTVAFSDQRQTKILTEEKIISLVKDYNDQSIIFAASLNSIYKTLNNGETWKKIYNISKANKKINKIYVDSSFRDVIYVATQDGLYQSNNQGSDWQRIFRESSELENNCLVIVRSNNTLYLGTMQGLFISYDLGRQWHKSFKHFSDSIISSIAVSPGDDKDIYVGCEKGIYVTEDNGKSYKRIYVFYRSEIPLEDYNDYDAEVSDQILNIKSMLISFRKPNRLYVATTTGVIFTDDKGKKWQKLTTFGLPSLNIRSMALSSNSDKLFVATDKGIFKLNGDFWQRAGSGLTYSDFYDLNIDKNDLVRIAGRGGLFEFNINENGEFKGNHAVDERKITKFDIDSLFEGEPKIEEIQGAAIEYSEVNMNKIKSWRKQARLKALFPTVSVGYDKSIYGSSSGAMAIGPRDWNVDLSWDVADFIWSSDQTSIDSRSRLTVQLRQDILDQVTHFYYERRRLKAELLLSPPKDKEEELRKRLELEEVTANLDGLTNGHFSKSLQKRQ